MGDVKRATRWAAWVGQAISWLFIIGGASMAFGVTPALLWHRAGRRAWLAFIGWFLRNAAVQSYSQLVMRDILGGVPVQRIMRLNPPTVTRAISVNSLVHDHVMGNDDHAFPVMEDGRLAGLVTLEDVRRVAPEDWANTPVAEIMTPVNHWWWWARRRMRRTR